VTGEFLGSHGYMAPEVRNGHKADHRSDIFAVGAVLYRCLVGRAPEVGCALPSKHAVSPVWDNVVAKAIEADPAQRYESCSKLAADIAAAAESGEDSARQAPSTASTTPYPTIEVGPDHITINGIDFTFGTSIQELSTVIGRSSRVVEFPVERSVVRDHQTLVHYWDDVGPTATTMDRGALHSINVWLDTEPLSDAVSNPSPSEFRLPFVIDPPKHPFEGSVRINSSECMRETTLPQLRGMFEREGSECSWNEITDERSPLKIASPSDDLNVLDPDPSEKFDPLVNSVIVTGRETSQGSNRLACLLIVPATSSCLVHRNYNHRPGFNTACDSYSSDRLCKSLKKDGIDLEGDERPLLSLSRRIYASLTEGPADPIVLTNKRLLFCQRNLVRGHHWRSEPIDGTARFELKQVEVKYPPISTLLIRRFPRAISAVCMAFGLWLGSLWLAETGLKALGLGENLVVGIGVFFLISLFWGGLLLATSDELQYFLRVLRAAFRSVFSDADSTTLLGETYEHPGLEFTYESSIFDEQIMIWPMPYFSTGTPRIKHGDHTIQGLRYVLAWARRLSRDSRRYPGEASTPTSPRTNTD